MDFNTILLRFGLDPNDFINSLNEPIPFKGGFIYEIEQKAKDRICPKCHGNKCYKHGYFYTEKRCPQNEYINDIIRIKRVRLRCEECGHTFSPEIKGIENHKSISNQTKQFILNDFHKKITFADIGEKYGLTRARVLQLFDENIKFIPRAKMPRVLCIDEIKFIDEVGHKYAVIISDFETKTIIDIIRSRQMPYLKEYFSSIPLRERENVKIFISDMYEGYGTACQLYFPKAIHIVDLFHVVKLLTTAVNTLRTRTMNTMCPKKTPEYNFMKSNWKYFLCRNERIPNRTYTHKETGVITHYSDLVFDCIRINQDLWDGYNIMQELLHYNSYYNFDEALRFVERIINRLNNTKNEYLHTVAKTYYKNRYEIANGFNKRERDFRYTNSTAENLNNHIKTMVKIAYGYKNFERFRKRILLIDAYKKA